MIKIAFVVCCAAYATAEADAGLLYGGYAGLGYGIAAPIATGYGVTNVANTVGIAGGAPAAVPGLIGGYAGAGRYVANSAGTVHVAKREAEADAGLLYGGYGYGLAMLVLVMPELDMVILPMDTMAKDLLMLSQRLRLMLDFSMEDMDMVLVLAMLDMAMESLLMDTQLLDTMAKGLLMLMLDIFMVDMDMD